MYLVWINPPINFTFSDDSVFLKKILAGDINSLNLLVVHVLISCLLEKDMLSSQVQIIDHVANLSNQS